MCQLLYLESGKNNCIKINYVVIKLIYEALIVGNFIKLGYAAKVIDIDCFNLNVTKIPEMFGFVPFYNRVVLKQIFAANFLHVSICRLQLNSFLLFLYFCL